MRIVQWIAIAGMTLFLPISALALDLGASGLADAGGEAGIETSGTTGSLTSLVGGLVSVVLNILGALLFILFVYSGFLWMTAQGDSKQVEKAKTIMKNAVAGLLITLSANAIVFFLAANLPGGDLIWTQNTSDVESAAGLTGTGLFLENNIGALINVILNLLGVVLLLIFIYAGFLWMTAQGDSKQVDKAKTMMKNALIGLVITLLSRAIAGFVIQQLSDAGVAYYPEQSIHSVERA